jgi:hypothetical protein
MKRATYCLAFAAAILIPRPGAAAPITFTGSAPGLSASATFDVVGDTLYVELANLSTGTAYTPALALTGVLFSAPKTFTPQSAAIKSGSTQVGGACSVPGCASSTNLSGEWGYATGSYAGGATKAIASAGYITTGLPNNIGNFGPNGTAGSNLDDPNSLNGVNYGLVGPNYTVALASGQAASEPLVMNTAIFTLSGASGLLNSEITNVSFQYGTNFSETNVPSEVPAPEPGTLALVGTGLVGLWRLRAKRQR